MLVAGVHAESLAWIIVCLIYSNGLVDLSTAVTQFPLVKAGGSTGDWMKKYSLSSQSALTAAGNSRKCMNAHEMAFLVCLEDPSRHNRTIRAAPCMLRFGYD